MRLSPILVVRAQCRVQKWGIRWWGSRQRTVFGYAVQQRAQNAQRGQIHKRLHQNPNRCAGRTIEHPGRQLLNHVHRTLAANAAKNVATLPLDNLTNAGEAASPRMPGIQNLSFFNPVGVLSSYCTTPFTRTAPCAIVLHESSSLRIQTGRPCPVSKGQQHCDELGFKQSHLFATING